MLAFAVQMLPGHLVCGFVGISGRNEPRALLPPAATAAKLDEFGKPAWIALIILGFMVWWPVGLATLAFIVGSGRVSCWKSVDVSRWHGVADQMRPAGTWLPSAKRSCSAPFAIRSTGSYRRSSWRKRKDDERHRSQAVYDRCYREIELELLRSGVR